MGGRPKGEEGLMAAPETEGRTEWDRGRELSMAGDGRWSVLYQTQPGALASTTGGPAESQGGGWPTPHSER